MRYLIPAAGVGRRMRGALGGLPKCMIEIAGEPLIHVYSETRPEEGFAAVDPDLEDVYFQRLRQHGATPASLAA